MSLPPTEASLDGGALHHIPSHVSHDIPMPVAKSDDSVYDRVPPHRKVVITCVLALCGFLAPITFNSTGSIINLTNAIYLLFMGISPCFWGPISQVYGRRWVLSFVQFPRSAFTGALLFFACSLGTALSPNLPAFFVFRALTAFQGTSFLIVGSSCIGDIYGRPFIAGVIVTYRSWRVIFYLQAALGGLATVLVFFFLPETIHQKRSHELAGLSFGQKAGRLWQMTNPLRVIKLYRYPNLAAGSSALVWNMYSLLTPIRYIINPRFNLTTPIQSGLFYLAPGVGYIVGTFMGGRWADHTVKKWIEIRGVRVPEDRLRSCIPFLGAVIPGCMLIYGWSIEKKAGGIPLPVIVMFLQGVAQLFCFPSLNTYCLDVMQSRSAEVVAGNYLARYLFAAAGSAVVLPAVEKIGSWLVLNCKWAVSGRRRSRRPRHHSWGKSWRDKIDRPKQEKVSARPVHDEKLPA
ncbi:MFS transporter [Mycena olivaceomarginata]|nr:MFS transporter [Mycena olivaceomarginata]